MENLLLEDLCVLYINQKNIERDINDLFRGDFNLMFNLSNIILDLFNFPKDNTSECFNFNTQEFINGKTEDNIYCRDGLHEYFYNSKTGKELYNNLLEEIKVNNQYGMTRIIVK